MVSAVWRGSKWVLLALNGRAMVADDEWDEYLSLAARMFAEAAHDFTRVRAIAISDGGGPTWRQRRTLVERFPGQDFPAALITASRFARSIAAALSWVYPMGKSFAPRDFTRALGYLEISELEVPDLWQAIADADARIGVATVLEIGSQTGLSRRAITPG